MHSTFNRIRQQLDGSLLLQLAALLVLWRLGDALATLARLPLPGAILGMALLLVLLLCGGVGLESMRRGARLLLAEMLLFFVPAVLAILDHSELMGWEGLKVLAVIVAGTVIVMLVTVGTIGLAARLLHAASTSDSPRGHESPLPQLD